MTPAEMAALHAMAFPPESAWSEASFAAQLDTPHVHAFTAKHGFALTRTLAGETELLTLAVDPAHRRQHIAETLLTDWLRASQAQAQTAFLDVAADNAPACALYAKLHFTQIGRRKGYYPRKNAPPADALTLSRRLT